MTPELLSTAIFGGIVALGAAGLGLNFWFERKRREALRKLAVERGFAFFGT